MAKVSNREVYIPKEFLSLKDYFVITDSESFKRTKTVESKHVLNFINKNNGNSNSIYIFSNIQNQDFNTQTEGYFFSAANQQNPDTATKLYFNFKNIFGENVSELFQAIVDSDIVVVKMVNTLDFNNIVYIKPKDILVYEEHFEFDITVLNGLSYGNFIDKAPYVLNFELYDNERANISTKLDKSTYTGNAQDLDNAIKAIQFPDSVTKTGVVTLAGLNVNVTINAFNWRINQIVFNNTPVFSATLIAATANNFRYDLLQGNDAGAYSIKQGVQGLMLGTSPQPDTNHVALASILVLGATIQGTTPNAPVDVSNKLDKGGYVGTAQTLSDSINSLKTSIIPLKSQFTLVQKTTENTNNTIEINDYARGFGPGVGVDQEYYNFAQYLNLTGDNNVNNHLNYKPITVSLPNS